MKIKTSITLSDHLLTEVDRRAKRAKRNRSDFIEAAVSDFISRANRSEEDAHDLAILNRNADALNAEAADAILYQIPL